MSRKVEILRFRDRTLRAIRRFFQARSYIEVETPVRLLTPALEAHIDAQQSGGYYLRTSPEFHMKRLLVEGAQRIYQMGPCFRAGESGRRHRPEFCMLEWYETGADYLDILEQTQALLQQVSDEIGVRADLAGPWARVTVDDAFRQQAGIPASEALARGCFEELLVEKIEPALVRPTFLMDYPIELAALAKGRQDAPHIAERWELYIDGLELANAYSELTDATELRSRMVQWAAVRTADAREVYALDEAFLDAMGQGMPAAGGCALGVDRLIMLFSGAAHINEVVAFAE